MISTAILPCTKLNLVWRILDAGCSLALTLYIVLTQPYFLDKCSTLNTRRKILKPNWFWLIDPAISIFFKIFTPSYRKCPSVSCSGSFLFVNSPLNLLYELIGFHVKSVHGCMCLTKKPTLLDISLVIKCARSTCYRSCWQSVSYVLNKNVLWVKTNYFGNKHILFYAKLSDNRDWLNLWKLHGRYSTKQFNIESHYEYVIIHWEVFYC